MPDYNSMSDEELIQLAKGASTPNYAVSAPGKPVPDRTAFWVKAAGGDPDMAQKLQGMVEKDERPISENLAKEYAGAETTLERLERMAQLKNQGFGGKGVDTGPIVGMRTPEWAGGLRSYPDWASSWVNKDKGANASDRARLRQTIVQATNPIRKDTTGASAAMSEIEQWIAPMVPQDSDNDEDFNAKLQEAADATIKKYDITSRTLGQTGFRAPPTEELMKRRHAIQGYLPKQQGNIE